LKTMTKASVSSASNTLRRMYLRVPTPASSSRLPVAV
jgi:hypothetical protein